MGSKDSCGEGGCIDRRVVMVVMVLLKVKEPVLEEKNLMRWFGSPSHEEDFWSIFMGFSWFLFHIFEYAELLIM